MLKIKKASDDPQSMAQDGRSILKSLQNKSLPTVDLLVRESIQNSLDASTGMDSTLVQYTVGTFDTDSFASQLESINDSLSSEYSNNNQFLAISDKNTSGLTGDYVAKKGSSLNNSNFHKLVFGIGKNQEKDGAGGSWGLGKTSYFRIGNGIVVYYTRIKTGDSFEERLIVSLIEDNRSPNRLLKSSERGIAWWGEKEVDGILLPLLDTERIQEFLHLFGLRPYRNEETGTQIIIPYLSDEFINRNSKLNKNIYWLQNLEDEIRLAVQRWYYPRIENITYSNKHKQSNLLCVVNNELITYDSFETIFKIYQKLYNSALLGNPVDSSIVVNEVKIPRTALQQKDEVFGYVAFIEADKKKLEMLPPKNCFAPTTYLNQYDEQTVTNHDNNEKILAYCRKPGMIVEYDIAGSWLPNVRIQKEDHSILAIFVPNSLATLDSRYYAPNYTTVEQYLRATENADHAKWEDEHGFTLVKRAKKYVNSSILKYFNELDGDTSNSATSRLARLLGQSLMPKTGFGRSSSPKKNELPSNKTRKSSPKSSLTIKEVEIVSQNRIKLNVQLKLLPQKLETVKVVVQTQDTHLDTKGWAKEFPNIQFPFEIVDYTLLDNDRIEKVGLSDGELQISSSSKGEFNLSLVVNKYSNHYVPSIVITGTN